jgi:hypothetical protein
MFNEFYRLKSQELLNQLSQVRTFIKKHNPTIGILTEEVVRQFLSTFLPKGVNVEQGFIVNENGDLSKQIDIIIYDSHIYAPMYRVNDIIVIEQAAVIAIIEVKTTVKSSSAFHDVIKYFSTVGRSLDILPKTYLFILNSAPVHRLNEFFHSFKHPGEYQLFDHDTFQFLPDAIAGIDSSYFLQKSLIAFEYDRIGYMHYQYRDKTNQDISALELLYRDIYRSVALYISEKYKSIHVPLDIKNDKTLQSISVIELFSP